MSDTTSIRPLTGKSKLKRVQDKRVLKAKGDQRIPPRVPDQHPPFCTKTGKLTGLFQYPSVHVDAARVTMNRNGTWDQELLVKGTWYSSHDCFLMETAAAAANQIAVGIDSSGKVLLEDKPRRSFRKGQIDERGSAEPTLEVPATKAANN